MHASQATVDTSESRWLAGICQYSDKVPLHREYLYKVR